MANNQGPPGPAGPQGPRGFNGATGPAGPKGDRGLTGPVGPRGVAGQNGTIGPRGIQGLTGPAGPTGPAGGVINYSAIAALRGATTPANDTFAFVAGYYAEDDGGGGYYIYNAASVAPDDGGAVIAPSVGSGRWIRNFEELTVANPKWWGAKDDTTLAFDSYPAFAAAVAYLYSLPAVGSTYPGGTLRITGRAFRLSQALSITNELDIVGDGMGFNTVLYFYNKQTPDTYIDGIVVHPASVAGAQSYGSITGIKLKGYNTSGGSNNPSVPYYNSIDHLTDTADHPYVAGNGIVMFTRIYLERVNVETFAYDGIHVNTNSSTNNANVSGWKDCVSNNNGRHGVYIQGDNGNAGLIGNIDCNNNGGQGICEHSFLGNTYAAGQHAENGDFIRDVTVLAHAQGGTALTYGVEQTIFAGSKVQGGVYVTTDGGITWPELDLGYQDVTNASLDVVVRNLATRALVMSTTTLFAATPWGCFSLAGPTDYASGNVWAKVSTGLTTADGLSIDYDATGAKLYYGTNGGGVFLSTNAGTSWTAVNTGLGNLTINALACDPSTSGTVYAGTSNGVYKTTNSGTSWSAIATGFGSTVVNSLAMITGNILYAGCNDGKIYKSTDGSTWSLVFTEGAATPITGVALNAAAPTIVLAATNGAYVYVSTNSGSTWTQQTSGLTNYITGTPCTTFASALVTVNGRMYVGGTSTWPALYAQTGGVFHSDDNGATWTQGGAERTPKHGGGVRSIHSTNQSVFIGTYVEADQVMQLEPPTLVVGGILGQNISYQQLASNNFKVPCIGQAGIMGMANYCPTFTIPQVFQPKSTTTTITPVNVGTDTLIYADVTNIGGQLTMPAPSSTNNGAHVTIRRIDATANGCSLVASGGTFSSTGTNQLWLYGQNDYVHLVSDLANSQWRVLDRGQVIARSFTNATLPNPASITIDKYAIAYVSDLSKFVYFNGTAWTDLISRTVQSATTAGAVSINTQLGDTYKLTASGNVTGITLTGGLPSQQFALELVQNAGGTATWPTTITNARLAGGSFTKSAGANAVDTVTFRYNGSTWDETGRALALA